MSTALGRTTSMVRRLVFFGLIAIIIIWVLQENTHFLDPIIQVSPSVRPPTGTTYGGCTAPNRTYGLIPKLGLSSYTLAAGTNAKFAADKTKFPTYPATLTVYKLNKLYEKVDDVDRARLTAKNIGFNMDIFQTDGTILRWQNLDETRFFSFDKDTHIWSLSTDLNNTSLSYLSGTAIAYSRIGENIMRSIRASNSNYIGYEIDQEYILRKFDKTLENTDQISKANILKFNYYKKLEAITCKGTDNKPVTTQARVLSPDYKDQSFTAQITGLGDNLYTDLLSFGLREFEISSTSAIYGALTFEEAYSKLQNNQATLYWILKEGGNAYAQYKELKVTQFSILVDSTKIVYVEPQKYIEDDETTHYIQPYFQFSGKATLSNQEKADFIFLVPALRTEEYK